MKHNQKNDAELSKVESNFKIHFITTLLLLSYLVCSDSTLFFALFVILMKSEQVQCESIE